MLSPLRTLALGLMLASPAAAETAKFDLVLAGITAGSFSYDADIDDKTYSVTGRLKTSGMAAMLRKVSYTAAASGSVRGKTLQASRYDERADTGKRQSEVSMVWKAGVPQVVSYAPARKPRAWDIDAAAQTGTVDPLSAMLAVLRDVPAGQECGVRVAMFDGRRATEVSTGAPKTAGDRVICAGEYRRVAGFSPDDMAEKTRFPFTLTYAPGPGGQMQVQEVTMDTLFGKGRLVRR